MKRKIKNIFILTLLVGIFLVSVIAGAINAVSVDAEEHVYYTDFEGMVVNSSSTVDQNTGFIWASNWQNTKTVSRGGSTMLEMNIHDSSTYSIVGGFGIADKSNLARCINGEAYDVTTYFEMINIEFVFVEFVGGDGKWGSVKIYPDGSVMENTGGTNMSNVSYIDNILKFTYTMSFNSNENVNGYIKFTAYNTNGGKIYLDNVAIDYAKDVLNDNYEQMPVGEFDTHTATIFNHFYSETGVTSVFVKEDENVKAKMSFTLDQSTSGVGVFFINKLGFLNKNRDYTVSFDMETSNLSNLWIYYGGTWATPNSYMQINLSTNNVTVYGDCISDAIYSDGKLSFKLNTNVTFNDWMQFQFIAQAKVAKQESAVLVDNIKITQTPIVASLKLSTKGVKTNYFYDDELDLTNLVVTAVYTNGRSEVVSLDDCLVSGYDSQTPGNQKISVTYLGVTEAYEVIVSRKVKSLKLNTNELKVTYKYGEDIDLSNLKVIAEYVDNGSDEELVHGAAKHGYAIDLGGYDKTTPGTYTITIYYLDAFTTFKVTVSAKNSVTFDDYSFEGSGK